MSEERSDNFGICYTPLGNKTHAKFTGSAATLCGRHPNLMSRWDLSINDPLLEHVDCQRCRSTLDTYIEAEAKASGEMPHV